ncbi:methylmalonyl-CoA epimerase [Halobacteriales archaeon QS_4_66_20]|nr:MAG: methylmalonyl-CoA epimerase [Halobacteriales archaeon QS_4_66_20]
MSDPEQKETPEFQFDHAGIATDDAAGLADRYVDLLGTPVVHEETFDGMKVVFLRVGSSYFELLEPVESEGAIARYLERNGPGIHHLALRTDDIAGALQRARECGVELIDEEPRPGAWGHDVAFLHPKSTGGVLLEFVEH